MESFLGGLLFAAFLFAQLAALVAMRGVKGSHRSPASKATLRIGDMRVLWHAADEAGQVLPRFGGRLIRELKPE